MEFTLRHPQDPKATARVGHDPHRGLYVETTWNNVPVALDAMESSPVDPIVEILTFLVSFGFIEPDALDDVRRWRETPSCWRRTKPPRTVRRVLTIIEALSAAGS